MRKATKELALCSMLAALSVVLLCLGGIVPFAVYACPMLASGALLAVLLYMMGMLGHKLIGLPAPVGMLFLAVLLKLANVVSPRLQEGSQMVYKFFRTAVTYPILFAVGVAITPWHDDGCDSRSRADCNAKCGAFRIQNADIFGVL